MLESMCWKRDKLQIIIQLIRLLQIPDDLLASMYDDASPDPLIDDPDEECCLDGEFIVGWTWTRCSFRSFPNRFSTCSLSIETDRSVMRQCFAASHTTPSQPSSSFYDQVRVLFHNLIVLFMRLIASKNEELSLLRSPSQCPVATVDTPYSLFCRRSPLPTWRRHCCESTISS